MKVSAEEYKKLAKNTAKYRNRAGVYKGEYFHSRFESIRYEELMLLETAKEIFNLRKQVWWNLHVNKEKIGSYVADFQYVNKQGTLIIEDCKGYQTDLSKWKIKHFKAQYPEIEFRIVKEEKKRR